MAQEKQTPEEREAELARREAALAAREAQLAQEQAELADRKADFEEGPFSADSAPDGYYHQGTVCTDRTVPCAGGDPYQLLRAVRRVSAFLFCSR